MKGGQIKRYNYFYRGNTHYKIYCDDFKCSEQLLANILKKLHLLTVYLFNFNIRRPKWSNTL